MVFDMINVHFSLHFTYQIQLYSVHFLYREALSEIKKVRHDIAENISNAAVENDVENAEVHFDGDMSNNFMSIGNTDSENTKTAAPARVGSSYGASTSNTAPSDTFFKPSPAKR